LQIWEADKDDHMEKSAPRKLKRETTMRQQVKRKKGYMCGMKERQFLILSIEFLIVTYLLSVERTH
jgi:hypothetical protein